MSNNRENLLELGQLRLDPASVAMPGSVECSADGPEECRIMQNEKRRREQTRRREVNGRGEKSGFNGGGALPVLALESQ
jgi:hypothetical protein